MLPSGPSKPDMVPVTLEVRTGHVLRRRVAGGVGSQTQEALRADRCWHGGAKDFSFAQTLRNGRYQASENKT